MNTWNATDAKRNFSQLLRAAEAQPQLVVRRGKPLGVVIGYQQFVRMEARQSTDTVAGWLDQLEKIRDQEADPVTDSAAQWAGSQRARMQGEGRVVAQADALIGACAWEHALILATRNIKHFEGFGIPLFNPFDHQASC